MTTKVIECRDHGGKFEIPARRGRPPVRCSVDNVCSAYRKADARAIAARVAETLRGKLPEPAPKTARAVKRTPAQSTERARRDSAAIRGTELPAKPTTRTNPSLPLAQEAKALLEAQGWTCVGKAWRGTGEVAIPDEADWPCASVVGTRGEEIITLVWVNGIIKSQNYSLWNTSRPSMNGKPPSKLPFDPDEVSDSELARLLSGMGVTWWNRIGRSEETAILPSEKITIQHIFNGTGDETPGERVISFVSHDGSGFRAFRLDALIKIGK